MCPEREQTRGYPAGFDKSVSRSRSPTHTDEEAFKENELHSDFNRAIQEKRIVEYSRHPIHSIHPEKQFPDVKVQSGKEDHHVASFYLNKPVASPTAQSTSPWSIGHREFHMPINNNDDGHEAFRDTANHLRSLGYRYQNKMINTFAGKNPLAKQNEPSLYFTSHGTRAEGQLLSVLMRDRTPSPKRPSGGQTSSSAGHGGKSSPK